MEKEHPELCNWGDMDFNVVKKIASQLPEGIIVALHNNGESTLYPKFGDACKLFKKQIRVLDSNGKHILEKFDEIVNNLDTLTISVIENDPEQDEQYEIVRKFIKLKGNRKPRLIYRLLGDVGKIDIEKFQRKCSYQERINRWYKLPGLVATRTLHNPYGSYDYEKKVTIPEIGICWDVLSHLVICRDGSVFPCIRYNPYKYNLLGNIKDIPLIEIWNGDIRKKLITEHVNGNRKSNKLCEKCNYWGIPIG